MTQSIIITGAGRGIGKATARAFLDAGWNVGLVGRDAAALRAAAQDHPAALPIPCDVTDESAVRHSFSQAAAQWGQLDVLFNNAGVALPATSPDEIEVSAWRHLIDVNLTGSFICAKVAFALMRAQTPQGGRIINNGSVSAHVPRAGSAAYTASKHAITGLTRSLSLDGRPYSIACGQIDIGNALTEMVEAIIAQSPADKGQRPGAEPVMDVNHVASSVLHMAQMPLSANVQFMTVMATNMPYIGRG
jgi:NAD(P)-dependent dehydrogenase (short-subunit alcohol dehydrogenase family)